MFAALGPHSSLGFRCLFANLWCFGGLFDALCRRRGGELNAMTRTTCAFTGLHGSEAFNVLPTSASAVVNIRILSPDTQESVLLRLNALAGKFGVEATSIYGNEPSPCSNMETEGFSRFRRTVKAVWPDAVLSPYLMMACSDSRFYHRVSDTVLRFSAMRLSAEDRARIHGNDERISKAQLRDALEFYTRLILNS
jgi:carboxypeptidase PM20D1